MVPDARTFRVLPWVPKTGWVLCDLQFAGGRPVPFDTRAQLRKALAALGHVAEADAAKALQIHGAHGQAEGGEQPRMGIAEAGAGHSPV